MKISAMLCAALLFLFSATLNADTPSPTFDKPVTVKRIPLAPDPLNPQAKPELACFYFPHFMVKQVSLGEVGAQQLSIIPVPAGGREPVCQQKNIRGEKIVDATTWSGWFEGVKGNYIFSGAGDGWNGGTPFAVIDSSTAKIVFEDVALNDLRVTLIRDSELHLRYQRVYGADCSLFADEAGCWIKIKKHTGLTASSPPDCKADYEKEQKRTPDHAKEIVNDPSIVYYNVETIGGEGGWKIRPLPSVIACTAAE